MNNWIFNGEDFIDTPEDYIGFVYLITNTKNNRQYVGKKLFHKIVRYKKKPKKRRKPSNWNKYYGSSKFLLEDIEEIGQDNIQRRILYLCKSKGEMSILEAYEQITRDVLIDQGYYNGFIGCKVHSIHITDKENLTNNMLQAKKELQ